MTGLEGIRNEDIYGEDPVVEAMKNSLNGSAFTRQKYTEYVQGLRGDSSALTPGSVFEENEDPFSGRLMEDSAAAEAYSEESVYDGIVEMPTEEKIRDNRANEQSAFVQFVNGLGKFGTTATTTFLNGTVGAVWGIGSAIVNGDATRIFNNNFINAMSDFNEYMEKVMPNYYTTDQQKEGFSLGKMATMNFWADSFIKNMGFTVGAIGSSMVGLGLLSNAFKVLKASSMAMDIVGSLYGAINEGAFEANNLYRDKVKLESAQLGDEYKKMRDAILADRKLSDEDKAYRISQLGDNYDKAMSDIEQRASAAGMSDFILNTAYLTLSNHLEFGRIFRQGAKEAMTEAGRLVRETSKGVYGASKRRGTLEALGRGVNEGLEEMNQAWFESGSNKANTYKDSPEAFRQILLDGKSKVEQWDTTSAIMKGFLDVYGNKDRWEEGFIGFLTGLSGSASFGKTNNSGPETILGRGKAIGWSGGVFGAMQAANEDNKKAEEYAKHMNEFASKYGMSEKTVDKAILMNNLNAMMSQVNDRMAGAAENGDTFDYINNKDNSDFMALHAFAATGHLGAIENIVKSSLNSSDMNSKALADLCKIMTDNGTKNMNDSKFSDGSKVYDENDFNNDEEKAKEINDFFRERKQEFLDNIKDYKEAFGYINSRVANADSVTFDQKTELAWLAYKVKMFIKRSDSIMNDENKSLAKKLRSNLSQMQEQISNGFAYKAAIEDEIDSLKVQIDEGVNVERNKKRLEEKKKDLESANKDVEKVKNVNTYINDFIDLLTYSLDDKMPGIFKSSIQLDLYDRLNELVNENSEFYDIVNNISREAINRTDMSNLISDLKDVFRLNELEKQFSDKLDTYLSNPKKQKEEHEKHIEEEETKAKEEEVRITKNDTQEKFEGFYDNNVVRFIPYSNLKEIYLKLNLITLNSDYVKAIENAVALQYLNKRITELLEQKISENNNPTIAKNIKDIRELVNEITNLDPEKAKDTVLKDDQYLEKITINLEDTRKFVTDLMGISRKINNGEELTEEENDTRAFLTEVFSSAFSEFDDIKRQAHTEIESIITNNSASTKRNVEELLEKTGGESLEEGSDNAEYEAKDDKSPQEEEKVALDESVEQVAEDEAKFTPGNDSVGKTPEIRKNTLSDSYINKLSGLIHDGIKGFFIDARKITINRAKSVLTNEDSIETGIRELYNNYKDYIKATPDEFRKKIIDIINNFSKTPDSFEKQNNEVYIDDTIETDSKDKTITDDEIEKKEEDFEEKNVIYNNVLEFNYLKDKNSLNSTPYVYSYEFIKQRGDETKEEADIRVKRAQAIREYFVKNGVFRNMENVNEGDEIFFITDSLFDEFNDSKDGPVILMAVKDGESYNVVGVVPGKNERIQNGADDVKTIYSLFDNSKLEKVDNSNFSNIIYEGSRLSSHVNKRVIGRVAFSNSSKTVKEAFGYNDNEKAVFGIVKDKDGNIKTHDRKINVINSQNYTKPGQPVLLIPVRSKDNKNQYKATRIILNSYGSEDCFLSKYIDKVLDGFGETINLGDSDMRIKFVKVLSDLFAVYVNDKDQNKRGFHISVYEDKLRISVVRSSNVAETIFESKNTVVSINEIKQALKDNHILIKIDKNRLMSDDGTKSIDIEGTYYSYSEIVSMSVKTNIDAQQGSENDINYRRTLINNSFCINSLDVNGKEKNGSVSDFEPSSSNNRSQVVSYNNAKKNKSNIAYRVYIDDSGDIAKITSEDGSKSYDLDDFNEDEKKILKALYFIKKNELINYSEIGYERMNDIYDISLIKDQIGISADYFNSKTGEFGVLETFKRVYDANKKEDPTEGFDPNAVGTPISKVDFLNSLGKSSEESDTTATIEEPFSPSNDSVDTDSDTSDTVVEDDNTSQSVDEPVNDFSDEDYDEDYSIGDAFSVATNDSNTDGAMDYNKEKAFIDRILPQLSEEGRIRLLDKIIESTKDGSPVRAWGMYSNGVISLYNGSAKGTALHEAFHFVSDMILSPEEREEMYSLAAKEFGMSNSTAKDKMAIEERLAEEYVDFTLNDVYREQSLSDKLYNFFNKIFEFIRNIMGFDNGVSKIDNLDTLFSNINRGKYSSTELNNESNSLSKYRSSINSKLKSQISDPLKNGIISYDQAVNLVNEMKDIYSSNGYSVDISIDSRTGNVSCYSVSKSDSLKTSYSIKSYHKNKLSYGDLSDGRKSYLRSSGISISEYESMSEEEKENLWNCK